MLQAQLYATACARLGRDRIVTGHALVGFEQDASCVVGHFAEQATSSVRLRVQGDVLVGADGLHSTVRRHHYPDQPLRFAGQSMWRGAVTAPTFLGGRSMIIAGHRDQKIVAYPMTPSRDGQATINWIAELGQSTDAPPREDWNRQVDRSRFVDRFSDWRFGWLDAPDLIARTETILEFPKFDRDPVAQWSFGRVTLLGDAAHPMHPAGSQAGSQAILDARALAWHLARHGDDVTAALRAYEAERLPVTRDIALQNRAMGAEAMMDLAEARAPQGFTDIDTILPRAEREALAESYCSRSGLDVQAVNYRASYAVTLA
jgi:2-polyprenyl-6-methoxyphenol hydroxylase-like FAD-dependent oxidoreductase